MSKASFVLTFDERDDGVKTWSACCSHCAAPLVGERYPQVTVLRVNTDDTPASQFDLIKRKAADAWDSARKTGHPVVIGDPRIVVDKTIDLGDLQRALEAHAEACPGRRDLARPEPTSMPGPGEPLR